MPDEHPLSLRQPDQARADFAAVADDLDFLKGSARADSDAEELARTALGIILRAAGLVPGWMQVFWRACL